MKVSIIGYSTCCLNHTGGVQVRIKKIYELLNLRSDVEVEYFCPMKTDFESIDVLHLFKLNFEYFNLVRKAKAKGIKIVLSSIVPLSGGSRIDLYRRFINKFPLMTIYKMVFDILSHVDALIVETQEELDFIVKHYGVDVSKIVVIPNGVEVYSYDGNEIFDKIRGLKDYVLHVGRIDSNKNQFNLIKALKGTGIDVLLIGGEDTNSLSYVEKCKELAKGDNHFHFLGWIDSNSNLLKSAYANAKVFAFPSYQETFGLALLEAAVAGCNIAMSDTLPIHGFHVFDDSFIFSPSNFEDIRAKILSAFYFPKNDIIKQRVIDTFSWDKIIESHVALYESLCK